MPLYLLKHTIDVCFQGIRLSYHIVGAFLSLWCNGTEVKHLLCI